MRMWEILVETSKLDFQSKHSGQLALAIHQMTGAEMVRVVSSGKVLRVINQINDDAFLDIDGVHSKIELESQASQPIELKPISEKEMEEIHRKASAKQADPSSPSYQSDAKSKQAKLTVGDDVKREAERLIATYNVGTKYE